MAKNASEKGDTPFQPSVFLRYIGVTFEENKLFATLLLNF
jgi:hypothetical protein